MAPIHEATRSGMLEEVMRLVEQDPHSIHSIEENTGSEWSPLHWACAMGHTSVVAYLLHQGALIDTLAPSDATTPLLLATQYSHTDTVSLLLSHGANPTIMNSYGLSPLMESTLWRNTAMVSYLIQHHIPLDTINSSGKTALW